MNNALQIALYVYSTAAVSATLLLVGSYVLTRVLGEDDERGWPLATLVSVVFAMFLSVLIAIITANGVQ